MGREWCSPWSNEEMLSLMLNVYAQANGELGHADQIQKHTRGPYFAVGLTPGSWLKRGPTQSL